MKDQLEARRQKMKTIDELTKEEVNALTDEQVQRFIDIACMEAGALLLPPMPVQPDIHRPETDQWVYEVGGFNITTLEGAMVIVEALTKVRIVYLGWVSGYNGNFIRNDEQVPEIKKKPVYSNALHAKLSVLLAEQATQQRTYDSELAEYNKIAKSRSSISDSIWNHVNDIKKLFTLRDRLTAEFLRYKELAEADTKVALVFFKKAYAEKLEQLGDLQSMFEQQLETL
jgi:hypothetical protein